MIVLTRSVTYTVDELGACASSIFCESPRFDLLRSFVGHPHDRFPTHLFDVASSVAVQTSSESQPIFTRNHTKDAEARQLYLSASTVRSTSSATLIPCNVTWRISLRVFRSGKSTRIRRGSLFVQYLIRWNWNYQSYQEQEQEQENINKICRLSPSQHSFIKIERTVCGRNHHHPANIS